MKNFKELATKATSLSSIMEGRTKISTDELIETYPDGVKITGFDYIPNKKNEKYPVFTIEEDNEVFVNGGTVIKRIFDDFVGACDCDVDEASRELKRQGGLNVKFYWGETKAGDKLVKVEIL